MNAPVPMEQVKLPNGLGTGAPQLHEHKVPPFAPELNENKATSMCSYCSASRSAQGSRAASIDSHLSLLDGEQSLRGVIQEELRGFGVRITTELRASIDECSANIEGIRNFMERREDRFEHLLGKASVDRRENEVTGAPDPAFQQPVTPEVEPQEKQTVKHWVDFKEAVEDEELDNFLRPVLNRNMEKKSIWHKLCDRVQKGHLVQQTIPLTRLAKVTRTRAFMGCQIFLILSNTCLMGYEADVLTRAALDSERAVQADWLNVCNSVFTWVFIAELAFRIIALRSWFWVAPDDWGWNLFDLFVVLSSLLSEMLNGINLSFVRAFRILRVIRAARIIRMLSFFRTLRKMLFAILASLQSLAWCCVFFSLATFMFSIFLLQGIVYYIDDADRNSPDYVTVHADLKETYGSLGASMFSLLAACTGGNDWLEIMAPLIPVGRLYTSGFVMFMLFITLGIMNVLISLFVGAAGDFVDQSLIVQNEQVKADNYVKQMLDLFKELDVAGTGDISWHAFRKQMHNERVQAYLSYHGLEPTHARLIFDLLDSQNDGKVSLADFVMGMQRLKGEARAVDARIIQREISMLPTMFHSRVSKEPPPAHAGSV